MYYSNIFDYVFNVLFSLEALAKIIALGFCGEDGSYLTE
jgi:hypothetical protein